MCELKTCVRKSNHIWGLSFGKFCIVHQIHQAPWTGSRVIFGLWRLNCWYWKSVWCGIWIQATEEVLRRFNLTLSLNILFKWQTRMWKKDSWIKVLLHSLFAKPQSSQCVFFSFPRIDVSMHTICLYMPFRIVPRPFLSLSTEKILWS